MALVIFQSRFAPLNGTDTNYDKYLTFKSHVNERSVKRYTSFNVHRPREIPSAEHIADALNGKNSNFNSTKLYDHEILRPITMKEYLTLGQLMKTQHYKINKKKEKIIKL